MSVEAVAPGPSPATAETPSMEARGVTVRFGGLIALSDVSISVLPGSIVGLVGPNGAGKTTFFGVVSGLLRPNSGEVFLGGTRVTHASAPARARLGLARTFQQLELFLGLTVRDHIVLGYRVRNERRRLWLDLLDAGALRRPSKDETERVDRLLTLLDLRAVADAPASTLPLGTARRVEVARALATSPSVLLLDEPSSGLDGHETKRLADALRSIVAEENISMLLVEHDVAMVLGISDRVMVLDFGVRIAEGAPAEIRVNPAVRAAYLGDDEAIAGGAAT